MSEKSTSSVHSLNKHSLVIGCEWDIVSAAGWKKDWTWGSWEGEDLLSMVDSVVI